MINNRFPLITIYDYVRATVYVESSMREQCKTLPGSSLRLSTHTNSHSITIITIFFFLKGSQKTITSREPYESGRRGREGDTRPSREMLTERFHHAVGMQLPLISFRMQTDFLPSSCRFCVHCVFVWRLLSPNVNGLLYANVHTRTHAYIRVSTHIWMHVYYIYIYADIHTCMLIYTYTETDKGDMQT